MMLVHIKPEGHYIGQVRKAGRRCKWKQIGEDRATAERALQDVALHMPDHKRGRVLFIDESGYRDPNIVMEVDRT